jgi:hypothetical protein
MKFMFLRKGTHTVGPLITNSCPTVTSMCFTENAYHSERQRVLLRRVHTCVIFGRDRDVEPQIRQSKLQGGATDVVCSCSGFKRSGIHRTRRVHVDHGGTRRNVTGSHGSVTRSVGPKCGIFGVSLGVELLLMGQIGADLDQVKTF